MQITGQLCRDFDIQYTHNGKMLAKSVLCKEIGKEAHYLNIIAWEEVADDLQIAQYKKGDCLTVEGYIKKDTYYNKATGENKETKEFVITKDLTNAKL